MSDVPTGELDPSIRFAISEIVCPEQIVSRDLMIGTDSVRIFNQVKPQHFRAERGPTIADLEAASNVLAQRIQGAEADIAIEKVAIPQNERLLKYGVTIIGAAVGLLPGVEAAMDFQDNGLGLKTWILGGLTAALVAGGRYSGKLLGTMMTRRSEGWVARQERTQERRLDLKGKIDSQILVIAEQQQAVKE